MRPILCISSLLLVLSSWTQAWTVSVSSSPRRLQTVARTMASSALTVDEDDDDFEYVEYDNLSEADLVGSEWLVGTNLNKKPSDIQETWVRLIQDSNGKNKCVWGDKSEGVWSIDVASQYVSMSKNYLWGKSIWAGVASDYYYLQGTVRAWTYVTPAEVDGQWQARRLGCDAEEAGVAPWFQEVNSDGGDDEPAALSEQT